MSITVTTINATEAKNRFGDVIRRAYQHREHLIVERGGIPVVAILPISDYEQYLTASESVVAPEIAVVVARQSFEVRARQRLQDFLAKIHAQMPDIAPDEVEDDIAGAVRAVRTQL